MDRQLVYGQAITRLIEEAGREASAHAVFGTECAGGLMELVKVGGWFMGNHGSACMFLYVDCFCLYTTCMYMYLYEYNIYVCV